MMMNQTRRPRPPGSRRSSAALTQPRAPAAEAPSLPPKRLTPRRRNSRPQQPFAGVTSGEAEDSPARPSARPSSVLSDSSLPSPPPPYRGLPPVFAIPPPPEVLESGPSSVRSSMLDNDEQDNEWVDEDTSQNTLTLSGLRQLVAGRDREELGGLDPLVAALGRLESGSLRHSRSPAAAMPGMIDLGSSQPSPSISRPSALRALSAPQQHTPRARVPSGGEMRQSLARAEAQASEDERRIAALEAALTEARESEDAQRKAAARLRRDLSTVRRQLQYAEDIAAEQKTLPQAPRFRVASRNSTPVLARKLQRRQKRLSVDERLGWGATSFPEFPGGQQLESDTSAVSHEEVSQVLSGETLDQLSELELPAERSLIAEVNEAERDASAALASSQATLRGTPAHAAPEPEAEAKPKPEPEQEGDLKIRSGEEASASSPDDASDARASGEVTGSPGKFLTERGRVRPALQSSTFITPAKSARRPFTPTRQVYGSSDYSSPVDSASSNRSMRSSSKVFTRRHSPVKRSSSHRRLYEHQRSPSYTSLSSAGAGMYGSISRMRPSPFHARNDSVRSLTSSDFLNLNDHRTLDAELGSSYNPSPSIYDTLRLPNSSFGESSLPSIGPTPQRSPLRSETSGSSRRRSTSSAGSATPVVRATRSLFTPSASAAASSTPCPAKFMLGGKLASPEEPGPYDTFSEGHARRTRARLAAALGGEQPLADESIDLTAGALLEPFEDAPDAPDTTLVVPSLQLSAPAPAAGAALPAFDFDTSAASLASVATQDPWDEYSDRATPSPSSRGRLRPLILCNRPEHARRASLATKRLSAAAHGNSLALAASSSASEAPRARARAHSRAGPVTIPGRLVHDFFCWTLILLDYLEWAIILVYRLCVDIRAGPDGIRAKRRPRAKRYYL